MGEKVVSRILPPPGLPRRLAFQSAIYAVGYGTYLTGSVVFFKLYVGLSAVQIGLGFSFAGFLGLVGALPLGHLADRIGGKRAWTCGAFASSAAFAAYPLARGFWSFLLLLAVVTLAEMVADAGRTVYTAAAIPREIRIRAMAFQRAYLNVGFTVGTGVGALALAADSRPGLLALVWVTSAGVLLNALFVTRLPHASVTLGPDDERTSPWSVLTDHSYLALAAVFALVGVLSETIFTELIPLWAITMTDTPKPVLGGLIALNTVMAVTLQVPATRGADSMGGVKRLARRAALATALACPVVALSGMTRGAATVAVLALAVVLTTCTELWGSAANWFVTTDVPPPGRRGVYVGANRTLMSIYRMVGPASMTFLAVRTGGWGWWVIAGVFAAASLAIAPAADWVARTRPAVPVPSRSG